MNNILIIQSRIDSTRLPAKAMLKLKDKTVIQHVVNRCLASKADKVVLAVPTQDINVYRNIVYGCDIFCGSNEDVLDRYYQCALKYNAKNIIRITGDCAVIAPSMINDALFHEKNHITYDLVTNSKLGEENFPDGQDVSIVTFEALEHMYNNATGKHREHVTSYIMENERDFEIIKMHPHLKYRNDGLTKLRLTLDYSEDYELMKILYEELYDKNQLFGLDEIMALYKKRPEIFDINKKYSRNEAYYA